MKYALANEQRVEAQPGRTAKCPGCGDPVVAKCGEIRIWHWSHLTNRNCDYEWENETDWHRAWKNNFPAEWQEIIHQAENGEKHIADVKTDQGWVLEFQHSPLKPEERQVRDTFYKKLVWVVDATRRKTDNKKFVEALNRGVRIFPNVNAFKVSPEKSALLREWADTNAPVFFDFGAGPALWLFYPKGPNGKKEHVVALMREEFIDLHRSSDPQKIQNFEGVLKGFTDFIFRRR